MFMTGSWSGFVDFRRASNAIDLRRSSAVVQTRRQGLAATRPGVGWPHPLHVNDRARWTSQLHEWQVSAA